MTLPAASKILSVMLVASASLVFTAPTAMAAPVAAPVVTGLPDFTDLIDKVGPAVVNIRTTEKLRQRGGPGDEEMQEFLRRFFGGGAVPRGTPNPRGGRGQQGGNDEQQVQRGVGSGFIVSADGLIMTNAHVVRDASEVTVKLTDRREFRAKVLGSDPRTDVAVLKID
ncbi:MAG: trypsin-like peptidase domain-containing protein, partial [Gammaproteobacteria bacterium]